MPDRELRADDFSKMWRFAPTKAKLHLIMVSAVLLATTAIARDPAWYLLTSKDAGFKISMPEKPSMEKKSVPLGNGKATVVRWICSDGLDTYVAASMPIPKDMQGAIRMELAKSDDQSQIQAVLESFAKGVASNFGNKIEAKAFGTWRGLPCLTSLTYFNGTEVRSTGMLTPERCYLLINIVPQGQEDSPEVQKFLASFQFMKG